MADALRVFAICGARDFEEAAAVAAATGVSLEGELGALALALAARKGDAPGVRALLAAGASPSVFPDILFAARTLAVFTLLVEAGADVLARRSGETLLHTSLSPDVLTFVLRGEFGKELLHASDASGDLPLDAAFRTRNFYQAYELIGAGARAGNRAALHLIRLIQDGDASDVVDLILETVPLSPRVATLALTSEARHCRDRTAALRAAALVRDHGARVDAVHSLFGATSLHWSAFRLNIDMVAALLRLGASVAVLDSRGNSPLDAALKNCLVVGSASAAYPCVSCYGPLRSFRFGHSSPEMEQEAFRRVARTVALLLWAGAPFQLASLHACLAKHPEFDAHVLPEVLSARGVPGGVAPSRRALRRALEMSQDRSRWLRLRAQNGTASDGSDDTLDHMGRLERAFCMAAPGRRVIADAQLWAASSLGNAAKACALATETICQASQIAIRLIRAKAYRGGGPAHYALVVSCGRWGRALELLRTVTRGPRAEELLRLRQELDAWCVRQAEISEELRAAIAINGV